MSVEVQDVLIPAEQARLKGIFTCPPGAVGVVLFAHGTGSNRLSSRNRYVAEALNRTGIGTLLFDLQPEDEAGDLQKASDIERLAGRLRAAARWLRERSESRDLPQGYYGASTGAAVALRAAAREPAGVTAIVSRGGRPDLAESDLAQVQAPTLFLVGERDEVVRHINEQARGRLQCPTELVVIPGAGHLFEEPGALDQVSRHATEWFQRHFEHSA